MAHERDLRERDPREDVSRDRDLTDRRAAVLRAVVQQYVDRGEPVGSKRLVEHTDLGVSPATVRSEMVALEEAGYLTQPHTSAGRIPTDKGYRYFVDVLAGPASLHPAQRAALEGLLLGSADLDELLRRASTALSQLTRFAALVVPPSFTSSRLRHIELVQLGSDTVLVVLISETGRVAKRMLSLDAPVAGDDVERARQLVNEAAVGVAFNHAPDILSGVATGAASELRSLVEAVGQALRADTARNDQEQVYVGGTANIAGSGWFHRLEEVKQVYEALEEQVMLLETLRGVLDTGDPGVRIGGEMPLAELAACSIVAASYGTAAATGSLGVLGPTRMDYPMTVATVEAVASSVEKALGELTADTENPTASA